MHRLVLFACGVAVAQALQAGSAPPSSSYIHDDRSLLSSLLRATGYSKTCVTAALDTCSAAQDQSCCAALIEEAREVLQQVTAAVSAWESQVNPAASTLPPPRHCKDLLHYGDRGRGLRQIYPYPGRPEENATVYCDHTIDGGGWTLLQRRSSDAVRQDFYRNWTEYRRGFGDPEGEVWIGLDLLHQLTSASQQQLRIDLQDYDGENRYAKYGYFHVGPLTTNYNLTVRNYRGDAGDSLTGHICQAFSTHDADNDKADNDNCAELFRGAWWYKKCHDANLNGYQYEGNDSPKGKGIVWHHWKGSEYSLKRVSMMTRPAF